MTDRQTDTDRRDATDYITTGCKVEINITCTC